MVTAIVSKISGVIWLATKRDQINWYNLNWSFVNLSLIEAGVRKTDVGRIASWASCAPSCCLPCTGLVAAYSAPYSSWINVEASALAISEIRVESVRIYVINPTLPSLPPKLIPSYNCCAAIIVLRVRKFNCVFAVCCIVDVVKAGCGLRLRSFASTFVISKSPFWSRRFMTSWTASLSGNSVFLPSTP